MNTPQKTDRSAELEKKSPITHPAVKNLQRNLRKTDVSRDFVNHDVEESEDEDSEDEVREESIRIVAPQRKKKHSLDFLLQELVVQQKMYLSSQKKVMKLQTEIDTEEVKTRYLKLDLNTAQVLAEERKTKLCETKGMLTRSQLENWVFRVLITLWFLNYVYTTIRSVF